MHDAVCTPAAGRTYGFAMGRLPRYALIFVLLGASLTARIAPAAATAVAPSAAAQFLLSLQDPDGSIHNFAAGAAAESYDPYKITPYFANYAVIGLAREARHNATIAAAAWKYLRWYGTAEITGIQTPINGISPDGMVYDYETDAAGSTAQPLYTRDSVDSYAATYLMAVRDMYLATGKLTTTLTATTPTRTADQLVANTLNVLVALSQNSDSLSIARQETPTIYSMDNAEVQAGLVAAYQLGTVLGDANISTTAQNLINSARPGMEANLWNSGGSTGQTGYYLSIPAPGSSGAPVSVDWSVPFYSGGAMSSMFAVALGATGTAPEGPQQRAGTLVNLLFSRNHVATGINCGAQSRYGTYWLEDAVCQSNLTGLAIGTLDVVDAKRVRDSSMCELFNTLGTPVPTYDGISCQSDAWWAALLDSNVGQLLMLTAALQPDPSAWQLVASPATP